MTNPTPLARVYKEFLEELRSFALERHEDAFVLLCTKALGGEQWALERVVSEHEAYVHTTITAIRDTDTTRPDAIFAQLYTSSRIAAECGLERVVDGPVIVVDDPVADTDNE